MKNIHFINVRQFGERNEPWMFFLGGELSDCIKRKQKHTIAQGTLVLGKDYNRTKSPTTNSKRQSTGAYPRRYKQPHAGFKGGKKQTIEG